MPSRPGKTAPRLLQDLLTYDPRFEERAGRNLLTTAPPQFNPQSPPERQVPARNCRHVFLAKHEQSLVPSAGEDADHETVYRIAAVCKNCRWHLDLLVDFRNDGYKNTPCRSGTDNPIHHYIFQEEIMRNNNPFVKQNIPGTHRFRCSAPRCPVELKIRLYQPRFTDEDITLLTNKMYLRKRLENSRVIGGDRADAQMARPVDALDFLYTYLSDALKPQKGKNRIPLLNRKFLKTFGKDCDEILKKLGFTDHVEVEESGTIDVWHLPNVAPASGPLEHDTERTVIEDARHELTILIHDFPEGERTSIRHSGVLPQPSITDLARTLGSLDYDRKPMTRAEARAMDESEDHPYYAGLGAVGDFSDPLLLFAFARQMAVDIENSSYYFECLQDIALGRQSDVLQSQVGILASQGQTNRKDVDDAYRYLGLDPTHVQALSDDFIISQFRSRLQDISPAMVESTRNMLRVIGHARQSEKIKQEASDAIESYEQAMSWLGLDPGQHDDFVITMFTLKVNENASSRATAIKAVEKIAEHRRSERLRVFLDTGDVQGGGDMDTADAYALLGITNRAEKLDLDVLQATAETYTQGNPLSENKYQTAFELVRKDQLENHKESFDNRFNEPTTQHPLESWPVGCSNIGNTCYLNSVLQFLFTIKPLRDMVLNCDDHLQQISAEALEGKRVGRTAVTPERAEKAQQFIRELRKLFEKMIKSPTRTVRPEENLAALALAKTDAPSLETSMQPSTEQKLGDIGGMPVLGPMPNPEAQVEPIQADSVMGDTEDIKSDTSSTVAEPDVNSDHPMVVVNGGFVDPNVEEDGKPEPPSRPPPVPPRPQASTVGASAIKKIEFDAQQQDAAEVLNNVFDLLSCAIKGNGELDDGEQDDLIKRLFFSVVTTVTLSKDKEVARNKELQDNHMISTNGRDRPVYSALDDDFSRAEVETRSSDNNEKIFRYGFIERASPIQMINVKRLHFENNKAVKDNSHISLENVLYLDRYMKATRTMTETALEDLRKQLWDLDTKLRAMEARKAVLTETTLNAPLAEVVEDGALMIDDIAKSNGSRLIDIDDDQIPAHPELVEQMRERARHLQRETESLLERMKEIDVKKNSIFEDCKDQPYHLHAVFIHRGTATGGHYWIYIRDFQNDVWRKYNDERVEEVEPDKVQEIIFQQEKTHPATSTGIVYVREDLLQELTEAVKRDPQTKEVEMTDLDGQKVEVINGIEDS